MDEKVTGIGGIFFKSPDPKKACDWYDKHLGIQFGEQTYRSFQWKEQETGEQGSTVFSFFKNETTYLDPSKSPFIINFRVKNLDTLLSQLQSEGVTIVGEPQTYSYGKFAWILDPDGNKIELWEPIEAGFDSEG